MKKRSSRALFRAALLTILLAALLATPTEVRAEIQKIPIADLNFASGLAVGPEGDFWTVTDKGRKLIRFNTGKGVVDSKEISFPENIEAGIKSLRPEFRFKRLDLEGITYDPDKVVFYIISEENRAVLAVGRDGVVRDYFFVEGEDTEYNQGLEGITFDPKEKIIYVNDEGPMDGPKRVHRYFTDGRMNGVPLKIDVPKRITGIKYIGGGMFLALNTVKTGRERMHRVIGFNRNGLVGLLTDLEAEYPGFQKGSERFETNYEGIEVGEDGTVYIINDAKRGDGTNLLALAREKGKIFSELLKPLPDEEPEAVDTPYLALLWMHTSAEYRALCYEIYKNALRAVTEEVSKRGTDEGGKKLAVVMDLDETVLDNTGFNIYLAKNDMSYSPGAWKAWLTAYSDGADGPNGPNGASGSGGVGLVPGALKFIKGVEHLGVEVVFISNRPRPLRRVTFSTLKRLGVFDKTALYDVEKERMLLKKDTSGKERRRRKVRETYTIIALFGDNLADFARGFEADETGSYTERKALVDTHAFEWGRTWFVLPNPLYGDWRKSLDKETIEEILHGEILHGESD